MKKRKKLGLVEQQTLSNRVGVQGQFIRELEKEIFENVNQVLCLARIKLNGINWNDREDSVKVVGQSDELIVKAIHDLRNLARQAKEF